MWRQSLDVAGSSVALLEACSVETKRRKHLVFGVLTVASTFLVFLPSLNLGFVWDDSALIVHNNNVHSASLWKVWFLRLWDASGVSTSMINPLYADVYRPWITFSYAVVYRLIGADAFAFHALNIVLHICVTSLAYFWLQARVPQAPVASLMPTTLFFAIHPTKVESVTWISGAPDVWLGLFVLLALISRERLKGWQRHLVIFASCALAMFSKETAIMLGAWFLTEDYIARRLRVNWRDHLSWFGGLVVALVFRSMAVSASGAALSERIVNDIAGFGGVASSYGHYLRQTILFFDPAIHPSYLHYKPVNVPVYDAWSVWVGGAFVIAVLGLALRNLKRPPIAKRAFLALWFFLLFLLPVFECSADGSQQPHRGSVSLPPSARCFPPTHSLASRPEFNRASIYENGLTTAGARSRTRRVSRRQPHPGLQQRSDNPRECA